MKLLNIGCGTSYHPAWVKVDLQPPAPGILRHDAAHALPFPGGSFDACCGSPLPEHPEQSPIPGLASCRTDSVAGAPRKPDSLFPEGVRP